jgi:uncharacterized repeat protein (TIGR03843 family)
MPGGRTETDTRLLNASLRLVGRLPWSSNATFIVALESDDGESLAVYKPSAGERPLWDFPAGTLHRRELAAYVVSRALDWDQVPESVIRDGPLGPGLVQRFVDHDPDRHLLALADPDEFWVLRLVAFDAIINNADRKSGHVLEDADGRLWAIDHGLAFHAETKLRTVIWQFANQEIPPGILHDLSSLAEALRGAEMSRELRDLLTLEERTAFERRIRNLLRTRRYPAIPSDRPEIPWPPV